MIVVAVLMTSCHVSEKPNIGPNIAQIKIRNTAEINAQGLPTMTDVVWANVWNKSLVLPVFFGADDDSFGDFFFITELTRIALWKENFVRRSVERLQ